MLTADDVLDVVRVHADRLHDAARRLGCGPEAAARVVASSAMDLVDAVARNPDSVADPVGWLFARVRTLGHAAAGGDATLPLGSGLLSSDENQIRLAEALETRPERDRAALLLRDSYDLPVGSVAAALDLEPTSAMDVVGAARLSLLPALTGETPLVLPPHVQLAALARLAEGGQPASREAPARRHTQSCDQCAAVLDAQERARRLLSGLTVVALPDSDREQLLSRVETRARAVLPAALPQSEDEWEDQPHRHYSLSLMALGLVLAVGVGAGLGALASRSRGETNVAQQQPLPLVTAAPVITVGPPASASAPPSTSPSPRVFDVTPSPTPTPSATATPTPTSTASTVPLSLQLDPSTGAMDTQITVTGQGWLPATQVTVRFLNRIGGQAGATAVVVTDTQGTFTTTIAAHDGNGLNGPHTVTAADGTHQSQAIFTIT